MAVTASNKNARICSRVDRTGKLRTETRGRDKGTLKCAVSTNERNNSTQLHIFTQNGPVHLSGFEARTLFRTLLNHYYLTGKTDLL